MSAFDTIKQTIADLPISDILRARLDFAFDQSAALERQVGELQVKIGHLQAQLEVATSNFSKARSELERLEKEHAEEIRVHSTIEFRRGKRTGGVWMPFCPKCKMPAQVSDDWDVMCSANCGWISNVSKQDLPRVIAQL